MKPGTDWPPPRIGVVGGGQLGRMLALAAAPLGVPLTVLDPDPDPPAAVAAGHIRGSLTDPAALEALAATSDLLTIEIEHTDVEALRRIEARGTPVVPSPASLATIADKLAQKEALASAGLPVAPLLERTPTAGWRAGAAGAVQKLRFGGYDGRGVAVLAPGAAAPLEGPSFIESRVPIATEIAVITCRFRSGEVVSWPPVEMRFDPALNLVTHVVAPASIAPDRALAATRVARAAAAALGIVGLLAVELFVGEDGEVLINEVAPRPHNSGHLTIEASPVSQFRQQLQALLGWAPLPADLRSAAAMRNIVAASDCTPGPAAPRGLETAASVPGVAFHWYGKREQRPGRKMGHLTAVAATRDEALRLVDRAAEAIGWV